MTAYLTFIIISTFLVLSLLLLSLFLFLFLKLLNTFTFPYKTFILSAPVTFLPKFFFLFNHNFICALNDCIPSLWISSVISCGAQTFVNLIISFLLVHLETADYFWKMLLNLSQSSFLLSFSIVISTESFVNFLKRIAINSISGSLFKGECIFHLEKGMLKKKKKKVVAYR